MGLVAEDATVTVVGGVVVAMVARAAEAAFVVLPFMLEGRDVPIDLKITSFPSILLPNVTSEL